MVLPIQHGVQQPMLQHKWVKACSNLHCLHFSSPPRPPLQYYLGVKRDKKDTILLVFLANWRIGVGGHSQDFLYPLGIREESSFFCLLETITLDSLVWLWQIFSFSGIFFPWILLFMRGGENLWTVYPMCSSRCILSLSVVPWCQLAVSPLIKRQDL